MGELQLGQIIEDILTPTQYEREFITVPQSSERVEYAIKLPGQGEEPVYLPIDSKFYGGLLSSGRGVWVRAKRGDRALPQGSFG